VKTWSKVGLGTMLAGIMVLLIWFAKILEVPAIQVILASFVFVVGWEIFISTDDKEK